MKKMGKIKKILLKNGYHKNTVNTRSSRKSLSSPFLSDFALKSALCTLGFLGKASPPQTLKKSKISRESCYDSVNPRLVFTSKRVLSLARKDIQHTIQKSSVIYECMCLCDSRYVGRTSQRLQNRIKQHVPKWL